MTPPTASGGQAALAGMEPPVQTPARAALLDALADGFPLMVVARGNLREDARILDPDPATGRPLRIEVVLRQDVPHHPQCLPLVARLEAPELGSYALERDWAAERCARWRAGVELSVLGTGLEHGHLRHEPVLRLLHTAGIRPTRELAPLPPERYPPGAGRAPAANHPTDTSHGD